MLRSSPRRPRSPDLPILLPSPRSPRMSPGGSRYRVDSSSQRKRINISRLFLCICITGSVVCLLLSSVLYCTAPDNGSSPVHRSLLAIGDRTKPSSFTEHLVWLYDNIPPSTSQPIPYAYRRRKTNIPYNYITLSTQLSLNRFDRLVRLFERYKGPMSCAVYLPDEESIRSLDVLVEKQSQAFRDMVTLHLLFEKDPIDLEYPINTLRNLALFNIETEYFFILDADFMTSVNAHDYLYDFLLHNRLRNDTERFSTLYVLPAFDVFDNDVPQNRKELMHMMIRQRKGDNKRRRQRKVTMFHDYYKLGHRASEYKRWFNCQDEGRTHYPVTRYEYKFEPYVIGMTHAMHYFDEVSILVSIFFVCQSFVVYYLSQLLNHSLGQNL